MAVIHRMFGSLFDEFLLLFQPEDPQTFLGMRLSFPLAFCSCLILGLWIIGEPCDHQCFGPWTLAALEDSVAAK